MRYTKTITELFLNSIMSIIQSFWEKLMINPTWVIINKKRFSSFGHRDFYQFLYYFLINLDKPALHNIRLDFVDKNLYNEIATIYQKNKVVDVQYCPQNRSFVIYPRFCGESSWNIKIILTPKNLVQIITRNTYNPIRIDKNGMNNLCEKLEEVRNYLLNYSNEIPAISHWFFKRADFGRDCKVPLYGPIPPIEFHNIAGELIRLYAKLWPDGTHRLRLEQIIKRKKPLYEMIEEFLNV